MTSWIPLFVLVWISHLDVVCSEPIPLICFEENSTSSTVITHDSMLEMFGAMNLKDAIELIHRSAEKRSDIKVIIIGSVDDREFEQGRLDLGMYRAELVKSILVNCYSADYQIEVRYAQDECCLYKEYSSEIISNLRVLNDRVEETNAKLSFARSLSRSVSFEFHKCE